MSCAQCQRGQLTGSKEFVRGDVYLRDMKNTKWVERAGEASGTDAQRTHSRDQWRVVASDRQEPVLDVFERLHVEVSSGSGVRWPCG